ncbi:hypothetical protein NliqN6_1251 [Naganishia liquefaciens]|uniref:Ricin B lectin domain-containing protein n=1 Tax=Naganishia liquefaciens TaxID=104408 RepID=A0A8H3YD18_9TREE|nr:hypothetical protein NliqN6_1251 [Naganishia liquefaciens]
MMFSSTTLILALAALARSSNAAQVHQLANNGQCLTVANPNSGASVTLAACDSDNNQMSSTGQQWVISPGNNQGVQLYGTNLCLDAQSNPEAGRLVLVYPCIGTNPQTWYLTPDDRVAITGGNQCLSVAGSNAETQRCGPSIDAQAFNPTFLFDTPSSSSASSTASSTNGIVGGGVGSVTSSVASATSSLASAGSSVASQASSGVSSGIAAASSQVSSAIAAASQSASSVISSASSSASSAIASLSSSGASAASSAQAAATSGASAASGMASGASGGVSGGLASATSALQSAVSAATSAAAAVTSLRSSGVSELPSLGLPVAISLFGVAIGAFVF